MCPLKVFVKCIVLTSLLTRRLIGRRFDDPTVKKDMESWPFKVVDDNSNPRVEVQYLNETKTFSAQEISSMVLLKVRTPAYTTNFRITEY